MIHNRNISDNHNNLNFLRREKLFSDYILNNSRSMISIINRDYVYEKVNTAFCKAHKETEISIVGKSLSDIWGTDTFKKSIKKNIDRCFEGETIKYESSFTISGSGRRYFEVIFRPVPVESGEIKHLLAETFDITELVLTEKKASSREEELKRFETNLPIGLLRCGPDGSMMNTNKAFLTIMDCDEKDQINGKNLRDYYSEKELFDVHLQQLMDGQPRSFGRVALRTFRGGEIVCRISAFMVVDDNNEPYFADFSFEDSSRELMLENRLLDAQKLETIGSLAGGIAHDFNNILTTISGYSELLLNDAPKSSQSAENARKIMMSVSKARSLTNQILAFSRQIEQEKVIINIYDVLKETIGFIRSAAPANVKISSGIKKGKYPVLADPTQLFRVFLNVITNAIQAMEGNRGRIFVSLEMMADNQVRQYLTTDILAEEYVLISIRDTGKGMDPSQLKRIFEPFYTTRDIGKGSGLGLSVVHGIISEMGGEILVSSRINEGSVFDIYIPVSKYFTPLATNPGNNRIVFITGNKHESRILKLALESAGFNLTTIPDREYSIAKLPAGKNKPDLVIYMGDAKNVEAGVIIKQLSVQKSKMPVIWIADSTDDLLDQDVIDSGIVTQHLVKPVSLRDIVNAINSSIINHKS